MQIFLETSRLVLFVRPVWWLACLLLETAKRTNGFRDVSSCENAKRDVKRRDKCAFYGARVRKVIQLAVSKTEFYTRIFQFLKNPLQDRFFNKLKRSFLKWACPRSNNTCKAEALSEAEGGFVMLRWSPFAPRRDPRVPPYRLVGLHCAAGRLGQTTGAAQTKVTVAVATSASNQMLVYIFNSTKRCLDGWNIQNLKVFL